MSEIMNNLPEDVRKDFEIPANESKENQTITPIVENNEEEFNLEKRLQENIKDMQDAKLEGQNKFNNILDKIQIDLNSIEIVEKPAFEKLRDFEAVFKKKATFQIVAVQSGFSAHMSALKMQDIHNITNSTLDAYEHKKIMYQTIHSHIEDSSIGRIGFNDWLKLTSYHDFPTFLYGIYCQTYPESNEFEITCGSCKELTKISMNNESLIETYNEGIVLEKIREIISSSKTLEDLIGKSLVHTTTRILLPNSKLIIDIQTPSLWDHLELLKTANNNAIKNYGETIGLVLFIKNIYMIDYQSTMATGKPKYYPLNDKNEFVNVVRELSKDDGKFLETSVNERIERYAITYSIQNTKCSKCNDNLGSLPVDMETALFTQLRKEGLV